MEILNKEHTYRLYEAGEFGNKPKTWPTVQDFYEDIWTKPIVPRYKGVGGRQFKGYGQAMSPADLPQLVDLWVIEHKADPGLITINENLPDDYLLCQGEVFICPQHGWYVRYSTLKTQMRAALAGEEKHLSGLRAHKMLELYMDPCSFEKLLELLADYPGAIVEFSIWNVLVGNLGGRNTILWEVRNY